MPTWGHSRNVRRRAFPDTKVMGPLTSDSDCRVKCLIKLLITSDLPTCTQQQGVSFMLRFALLLCNVVLWVEECTHLLWKVCEHALHYLYVLQRT